MAAQQRLTAQQQCVLTSDSMHWCKYVLEITVGAMSDPLFPTKRLSDLAYAGADLKIFPFIVTGRVHIYLRNSV